jgi:hypothetical protein
MTARPSYNRKSDRLIYPGASADEIRCDTALAPVDRIATAMDQKWGIDRLVGLVSTETAARYGSALAKLNAAIATSNAEEVATRAAVLVRGYEAMDREAAAAGHTPAPPEAWEIEVGGAMCVVIRDGRDWPMCQAAHPGKRIYTLREVAVALEHLGGMVAAVKDAFPGATVTATRPKTELEESLNDTIPW